ncbi:uncharacterized protein F5Z01DRAFT_683549 [Emericellopsis atlantica]|uniref:Uncharacterized protein n=1 Tax=Emericellopsis atlantica TaxID=2614577 RepID=A0A9P7ZFK2_9HYPO|nr:uncharacterized protein F5Z01DRAFT_683549 [Emericellopsis atlantica]KAG9251065.1 hypothetical protein F5Z01DRAFT_683549 [Emericellopsis atlantica]
MATRELLSGPITLSDAKERGCNVPHRLEYPQLKHTFFQRLESQRPLIRAIVAHHLGVDPASCNVSPPEYWRHGSFNVYVPAPVDAPDPEQPGFVMVQFPLPYRVGEITRPGNADEQLRHCPSVPIPHLYGVGLFTGQQLTHISHLPWWSRWLHRLRQYIRSLFGYPCLTHYVPHNSGALTSLGLGYLRGLARILLSLVAIPLPRIGAFRLDDAGYTYLDNQNEDLPLDIPREETYTRADDYVLTYLDAFHNRLLHQPNTVADEIDGRFEIAGPAAARAIFPQILQKDLLSGPFNVMRIIDLKFACSWPLEFQQPPYWLGGQYADEIDRASFGPHHKRFIQILEEQEELLGAQTPRMLSARDILAHPRNPRDLIAFSSIFWYRILPYRLHLTIDHTTDLTLLANLWGGPGVIQKKVQDHEQYLKKLEGIFAGRDVEAAKA